MGTQSVGERTITLTDVNGGSTNVANAERTTIRAARQRHGERMVVAAHTVSSTLRRATVTSRARSSRGFPSFFSHERNKKHSRNRIRQRFSSNCVDQ